ncbi:MAG: F-box protein [Gammaproteobacteria bacterium]
MLILEMAETLRRLETEINSFIIPNNTLQALKERLAEITKNLSSCAGPIEDRKILILPNVINSLQLQAQAEKLSAKLTDMLEYVIASKNVRRAATGSSIPSSTTIVFPIMELPTEVLQYLLSFLDIKQLAAARSVSKYFDDNIKKTRIQGNYLVTKDLLINLKNFPSEKKYVTVENFFNVLHKTLSKPGEVEKIATSVQKAQQKMMRVHIRDGVNKLFSISIACLIIGAMLAFSLYQLRSPTENSPATELFLNAFSTVAASLLVMSIACIKIQPVCSNNLIIDSVARTSGFFARRRILNSLQALRNDQTQQEQTPEGSNNSQQEGSMLNV